jgi:hypothetical protein
VEAGISNFFSPASTDLGQQRSVASFRVHPGYVYAEIAQPDDVAVLALAAPLDLTGPAVQAVALPASSAPFPAAAAVAIAGFGSQDAAVARPSGALQSMTGTVDPQGQCGDFTPTNIMAADNAVILCAVSATSAICHGDSGAGVVSTGGTPVLVGVVNDSPAECMPGSRTISTYLGAPEVLRFVQGDDEPPTAPRPPSPSIRYGFSWPQPLVVGNTLACSTDGWPATVQIVYSFVNPTRGQVLQTGPNRHYLLPPTAAGVSVACTIALTNSGGTLIISGNPTDRIGHAPQVAIEPLASLTARRGQTVTVRVVLMSPRGLSGTFRVCAALPASIGGHACRSTIEPFGASGTFPFKLRLTIKPNAPQTTTQITVSATAGYSSAKTTALLRVSKP